MQRTLFFVLSVGIISCATQEKVGEVREWDAFGYEGLAQKINNVAGANSVDCGIYQLLSKEGQRNFKNGIRCAKNSAGNDVPFKLGSIRLPVDSLAYEALIYDENGKYTRVIYDLMIDRSDSQQWVYYCESIAYSVKDSTYDDSKCEYQENLEWP